MNAKELLEFLLGIQETQDLSEIKLNYRYDYDSDVVPIIAVEELYFDEETNNRLTDIVFVTDNEEK
jgi:hypothetical protein